MIFECIVTTLNEDDGLQISPMGPQVNDDWSAFELRPFAPSRTLDNLERSRAGVLHVFDRALIFAESVAGKEVSVKQTRQSDTIDGLILEDACRAFEFSVTHVDRSGNRASIQCQVERVHELRPYLGMNRARNAIIEASILVSRLMFIPIETIKNQFDSWDGIIERTGGEEEVAAFEILKSCLNDHLTDLENE